ncbi:hypothetical protein [Nocardioides campestrisoli]|uniref:hypothetical protein n=1 Tax=Nocardioides campestrisoli TaxID=2736757 RepID=UPI00163D5DD1|nr:hypothetical protein [Nocardioides campestrisoli]
MRRSATTPHATLALLAILGLSGCTQEDPEPAAAEPSPTATPSEAEATPDQTPDETPERFIHRWVHTETAMRNTGDTTAYDAITGPCAPCDELSDQVASYYAAGGYERWQGYTIRSFREVGDGLYEIATTFPPSEYKASAESAVQKVKGGSALFHLSVSIDGGRFVLQDVEKVGR